MMNFSTLHEKGWFKSMAAVVAFLVGVAALVSAATDWTHQAPVNEASQVTMAQAPVSNPVQGQKQPAAARVLDETFKQKLIQELNNPDARISIICLRKDPEAAKYARAIEDFLEMRHYNVGLAFSSMPASFKGVDIEKQGNRVFIRIGRNPE